MAAATRTQSKTNNVKVNAVKKQKVKWWVWVIAACALLFFVFVVWFYASGFTWMKQQKMLHSLEKRYGQQFVVGWPEHKDATVIGLTGDYVSVAYPVSDPSLKFTVKTSEDAPSSTTKLSGSVVDDYPMVIWEQEETNRLKPIIDNLFAGYYKDFEVSIGNLSGDGGDIDIRGTVPSFDSVIKKYGHTVHYTLRINNVSTQSEAEASKQLIAEKILALKSHLSASEIRFFFSYLVNTREDATYKYQYGVTFDDDEFVQIDNTAIIINDFKASTAWRIK